MRPELGVVEVKGRSRVRERNRVAVACSRGGASRGASESLLDGRGEREWIKAKRQAFVARAMSLRPQNQLEIARSLSPLDRFILSITRSEGIATSLRRPSRFLFRGKRGMQKKKLE